MSDYKDVISKSYITTSDYYNAEGKITLLNDKLPWHFKINNYGIHLLNKTDRDKKTEGNIIHENDTLLIHPISHFTDPKRTIGNFFLKELRLAINAVLL